jgi:hypothetical protein
MRWVLVFVLCAELAAAVVCYSSAVSDYKAARNEADTLRLELAIAESRILIYREAADMRDRHIRTAYGVAANLLEMSRIGYPNQPDDIIGTMNGYQRLLADLTAFLDRGAKGDF